MKLVKYLVIFSIIQFFCNQGHAVNIDNSELHDPMSPILVNENTIEKQLKIKKTVTKNPDLILIAIAISDGMRCCIINGKMLFVGDKIQGYTVDKITANQVHIVSDKQIHKILNIH